MTKICAELMSQIHPGQDPWAEFKPSIFNTALSDPFGFDGEPHPWLLDGAMLGGVVVEVGSFLGKSSRYMAGAMRAAASDGAVICIDTWLGDWELSYNEYRKTLGLFAGSPMFYYTFLKNTVDAELEGYTVPLRMDSYNASRVLENLHIQADFIYIDGSHDGDIVAQDLRSYWPLLKSGCALVCDDYYPGYAPFAGLVQAVDAFAKAHKVKLENSTLRKARLVKP